MKNQEQQTNIYDFILKLFVSNDTIRPQLTKPGEIENKVYSTDAHACIRFDKELCNKDYSNNEKFPDAKRIFDDNFPDLNLVTKIPTQELLEKLYDFDFKYNSNYVPCETCKGIGEKECICCGHESKCKQCDGEGSIEKNDHFCIVLLKEGDITLNNKILSSRLLYKLIEVAHILKAETIDYHYSKTTNHTIFKVGPQVEILIMAKILR